jgi:hypothetical protein
LTGLPSLIVLKRYLVYEFGKAKLGQFSGENNELTLLNIASFAKDLSAFVTDRSLEPKLKGSHGFELSFYSKKAIGHPWVKVMLCDYAPMDNEDNHDPLFCVSGEFEINHEYLNAYFEYFRSIVS